LRKQKFHKETQRRRTRRQNRTAKNVVTTFCIFLTLLTVHKAREIKLSKQGR